MAKKKKKKTGPWKILIAAALTIIAGIIIIVVLTGRQSTKPAGKAATTREISLFFTSDDGVYLTPEARSIRKGAESDEVRQSITELLSGSRKGLASAVPIGTRLRAVKVSEGTAVVDLSGELIRNHPGGSSGEILTVYAIVNTVTVNFPMIKSVQILVDGKVEKTIAGHIDIMLPLGTDRKIIKG